MAPPQELKKGGASEVALPPTPARETGESIDHEDFVDTVGSEEEITGLERTGR